MTGYANPVITKHFPELAADGGKVWVTIRNPKLLAPGELDTGNIEVGEGGMPKIGEDGMRVSFKLAAKLIIGWHVPDPGGPVELDEDGYPLPAAEGAEASLLPSPATPELIARLPIAIFAWLGDEIAKVNPQQPPAEPTSRTS